MSSGRSGSEEDGPEEDEDYKMEAKQEEDTNSKENRSSD